jgi:prepilin peptidase CpaA
VLSVVWVIFAAIMIAAIVIDLKSYRIPNGLVAALLVLFIIVAAANWNEVSWVGHIAAALVVFGAGIFLYALKQMGAGDVKLLAVVALWSGIFPLPALLFYVSLCGLVGMLLILGLRMIVPGSSPRPPSDRGPLPRLLTKGEGIPYAIGIGPGAIIASFSFAPWLWRL